MYMSDEQILRRIRRQLARLNIRVHKVIAMDGPRYVPYAEADPTDQGAPLTINGLIDFTERMAERRKEYLLTR